MAHPDGPGPPAMSANVSILILDFMLVTVHRMVDKTGTWDGCLSLGVLELGSPNGLVEISADLILFCSVLIGYESLS